jgi:hypothetical protein
VTGGGASLDDGRCRWSPLSTVSGRENVTVFTWRLALAEEEDADADDDCWLLESVRVTGIVVIAVVGTALGVVMVKPGLARMVVTVEAVEIFRRVVDVACCCDSEGRVGSGAGIVS